MLKLYVHATPEKGEWARGYAAGLSIDDEVEYEVVVSTKCPPGSIYITDKRLDGTQNGTSVETDSDDPKNVGSKPESGQK